MNKFLLIESMLLFFSFFLIEISSYILEPERERTKQKCGHVYITVSAHHKEKIVLNWNTRCNPPWELPAYVYLHDVDIRKQPNDYKTYAHIETKDHPGGSYLTDKKLTEWPSAFGGGPLNFAYWIVSRYKNNTIRDVQTFRLNPTWMYDNREPLNRQHVAEMLLPGTHNSGCYGGHGLWNNFKYTQDYSVRKQLEAGIRYLDLRIGYYDSDKKFYIMHDIWWIRKVEDVFDDIKEFIKLAPWEVIVIDFHRFPKPSDWSSDLHQSFAKFVLRHLGDYAFERKGDELTTYENKGPTMEEIWNAKKNIIFTHPKRHNIDTSDRNLFWGAVRQSWADTQSENSLYDYLEKEITSKKWTTFVALMGIYTPTPWDVVLSRNNLRKLADRVNPKLTKWVRDDWSNRVNIIATDYFFGNDLIEVAINQNTEK